MKENHVKNEVIVLTMQYVLKINDVNVWMVFQLKMVFVVCEKS